MSRLKPLAEEYLHIQICDYLRYRYPDVIFRTDFSSGIKLTIGQATKHKRLQSGRAYPDLFIAEPMYDKHGLFIELKREGTRVYLKDGSLSTQRHLQEQGRVLNELRKRGYAAEFGVGYKQTTEIIDKYFH